MTRKTARHAASGRQGKGGVYPARLIALLGAAAMIYGWALTPVLSSLRGAAARDLQQAKLARRLTDAAARNKVLALDFLSAQAALRRDTVRETSLRSTLAALKKQKPPAAPSLQSYGGIAVPAVQTTTGASGLP